MTETMVWNKMKLVRISTVPGFSEWLNGQTIPYVEGDPTPTDWAYFDDYYRYIRNMEVID
jgi:hypothetical protein